jgi:type III secretory pathway component EscV
MQQKIEQSTDVLKAIISPAMHEGDVKWPPKEPDTLKLMEKVRSHLSVIFCIPSAGLGHYLHFVMVFITLLSATIKINAL